MNHKIPERCNCGATDCPKCRPNDWWFTMQDDEPQSTCDICGAAADGTFTHDDAVVCEDCYELIQRTGVKPR